MPYDPLKYPDLEPRSMQSHELCQMLVTPILAVIFGFVNIVFSPPGYTNPLMLATRVFVPATFVLGIECAYWWIYHETLWQMYHRIIRHYADPERK